MRSSSIPRLVIAAAVALSMSCGTLAAQESNSGSIVVTLPADMDAEDRRALTDALATLDRPVAEIVIRAAGQLGVNARGVDGELVNTSGV